MQITGSTLIVPELFISDDGSHSLYDLEIQDTFHSKFGALTESRYIFIDRGLGEIQKKLINVLEIGFGTGLNAFLSLIYAQDNNKVLHYHSVDKYILPEHICINLNYPELLKKDKSTFLKLHSLPWNIEDKINNNFFLLKAHADLTSIQYFPACYDVIFFDAFAPGKQADLWTKNIFALIAKHTNPGGILITYTAKGSVKRLLQETGFKVGKLAGPPGKRHILKAVKINTTND